MREGSRWAFESSTARKWIRWIPTNYAYIVEGSVEWGRDPAWNECWCWWPTIESAMRLNWPRCRCRRQRGHRGNRPVGRLNETEPPLQWRPRAKYRNSSEVASSSVPFWADSDWPSWIWPLRRRPDSPCKLPAIHLGDWAFLSVALQTLNSPVCCLNVQHSCRHFFTASLFSFSLTSFSRICSLSSLSRDSRVNSGPPPSGVSSLCNCFYEN